jgi:hypothetical protein
VYIKDHARTVVVLATAVVLIAGGAGSGSTIGASTGGTGVSVSPEIGVRVNAKARDRSSRSVVRRLERVGLRIRTEAPRRVRRPMRLSDRREVAERRPALSVGEGVVTACGLRAQRC